MIYNKEFIQDNLREIWDTVSLSSFIEGKDWYFEANALCQDMSDQYHQPLEVVIGVLSALSIQKSWQHNIEIAKEFFETEGRVCKHTLNSRVKAKTIYNCHKAMGNRKEFVERVLNGPKIVNFFNNILNPLDKNYYTIDSHMINICTGDFKKKEVTSKQYEFLKNTCINFALSQNMLPSENQAILWQHIRKTKKGGI